ncbi:MAG: hypothetical protein QOF30_2527 [Acidimicrobiaceae bacterium]|jgi:hypothetical protein|nr:hypothetical protein [Acidimicrobiaceae bacterium]
MTVLRRGFDASSTPPDAQKAFELGFRVAIRYLSFQPNSKNLTVQEATRYHNAGLDIGLNWEQGAGDTLRGHAVGVAHATEANRQADVLGAPENVCIYYSTDTKATAAAIRDYYKGAGSINRRPVGGYGGSLAMLALLDEGTINYWWQANAGDWSGFQSPNFSSHPQACMRQLVDRRLGSGIGFSTLPTPPAAFPTQAQPNSLIDEDEILAKDCGFWLSPLNKGVNLMAFGPTGTRIDLTVTGTDGHPYIISADSPEALATAKFFEVGGPTALVTEILKEGWTADGSKYVILAKGTDGHVWVNVNRGNWFQIQAGIVE